MRKISFFKKMSFENLWIIVFSFIIFLSLLTYQLIYLNPFASTWDQVDFALAVSRYDLLAMQPHFPGYPYFILGGKLFSAIFVNHAKALTIFNVFLFSTTIYPVYRLGREYLSKEKALLLSVTLYSSSYILLLVNQPISEGAAISIFWWYIWSIEKSLQSQKKILVLLPLLFLSILFGIRLSYLPFTIGVIFLFYYKWKLKEISLKQLLLFSFIGILFQIVWVLAIALTEGSLTGFIKLSLAFTSGHFNDWGGSIGSNTLPLIERIYTFIIKNIIWTGFFAQSKAIMFIFVIILLFLLFLIYKERFSIDRFNVLIILFIVTYFTWALLAQNIDKPRHIIPLVMLSFLITFLMFLKKSNKMGIVLVSIFLATQFLHATHLLKEQATKLPATYQLEKFLEVKKRPFIVYTWEETRIFEYLHASFPHKRINTYEVFQHDFSYYEDYEILITDKVLLGFKNQGIDLKNHVELVAEFESNSLFDPVYNRITLYKWK